jgi:glycosyltransferase domain-containing protein
MTLCVPTKNRSDFLARFLSYYASANYQHWIFIGDSSDTHHLQRDQELINAYSNQLKIKYFECPNQSPGACVENLSRSVQTPYCLGMSDDDFVCPNGIDQCIEFLETNPDYSAAHGIGIYMGVRQSGPYGEVHETGHYPQATIEAATGAERVQAFFNNSLAALMHSVHRTEDWQAMYRGVSALSSVGNNNIFKDELIPGAVSVIRGKSIELDCFYFVRFLHDTMYQQILVYDWLTSPNWQTGFQLLCDRLNEELLRSDGISGGIAREAIKNAFWPYIVRVLNNEWNHYHSQPSAAESGRRKFRAMARRLPGLRQVWRRARYTRQKLGQNALSLPALLDPSSPYHADFMPVYTATTTPPEEQGLAGRA